MNLANRAVATGTMAITTLAVADVTAATPLLKAMVQKKNPNAPDATNIGISDLRGIFILVNTTVMIKVQDAIKYLRNPIENAE